ncbi:sulfite exporter TauE/SafE family protein [Desulfobacterota bacterium M19]
MEHLLIAPWILAILFGAVAFLYSSVGLAGGSSYIALLTIFGVDYLTIPTVALSMNIMVSTLGAWNFFRGRHVRPQLIWPFLVSAIPLAWIGGTVRLPARTFDILLMVFLAIVALRIYCFSSFQPLTRRPGRRAALVISLLIGSGLGFISGALGLGGGIYLIPLIVLFGLGSQKEAAACAVFFIWVNSTVGLAARLSNQPVPSLSVLLPLLIAVAAGGYTGSFLGANHFSPRAMQRLLGVIILVAILFLGRKMFFSC